MRCHGEVYGYFYVAPLVVVVVVVVVVGAARAPRRPRRARSTSTISRRALDVASARRS